jgi:hypothetical protein
MNRIKQYVTALLIFNLTCSLVFAAIAGNYAEPNKSPGIVFNGVYSAQKERWWQGGFHDQFLFSWFIPTTPATSRQEYLKLIDHQRKNGVKFTSYYYSSTTSKPPRPKGQYGSFPEEAIPPEAVDPAWIIRDTKGQPATWYDDKSIYFLDVGLREVQDAILLRAVRNAKSLGPNALYLDCWYYKTWAPGGMDRSVWTEKCLSLLKRARELTKQNGLKLVANTPSSPVYWHEFATYLDGIAYEMGANPNSLQKRDRYEEELSGYEKVLMMGKSIFLYSDRMTDDKGSRWDEDGRKVAATAMLVMPENQPYWGGIYVSQPRYEIWPVGGWPMWPEQLGRPLGPRQWEGDTVIRRFERGSISVTVGKMQKFTVTFEY